MKKILILVLVIILFSVFFARRNNNYKITISRLFKEAEIKPKELRYRIYLFGILPVGEAVFSQEKIEEYNGQKVYHLSAGAQSLKILSKFFSGYVVLDSYLDMQDFNPLLFKQKIIVSGKPDLIKEAYYDQKQRIMTISGVQREILPNTQDPLSAIFYFRHMDFDKTSNFEMNLNTNQKNYILEGTAEQKVLSLNKKIYKIASTKAEIRRRDKNPYHKTNISIVFLRGEENIPLLVKVFASGALINVKLISIE